MSAKSSSDQNETRLDHELAVAASLSRVVESELLPPQGKSGGGASLSALGSTKLYLIANYTNFLVMVLLNLCLTPVLLAGLGASQFGLWKACSRFLDFSSLADGRATQALKWVIAHRSSEVDDDGNRRQIGAALAVWLIWLPILFAMLAGTILALPHLIDGINISEIQVAQLTGILLASHLVFGGVFGIPDAVLIGSGQGYRSININTVVLILSSCGMALAASFGFGPIALAAITASGTSVNAAATWWIARRRVPWWGVARPRRTEIGALSRFSGWTLLWALAQQLMLSTELLLFAYLLGLTEVARYSITAFVSQSASMVVMLTTSAIIPGLGALIGAKQGDAAVEQVRKTREIALAVAMTAACGVLLFNHAFIGLWAGASNFLGSTLNALIACAFFQFALFRCDAQILDATLKVRGRAIQGTTISILALAGAVAAFRLTGRVEACYVALIGSRMLLNFGYAREVSREVPGSRYPLGKGLMALAMMAMCYMVGRYLTLPDWPQFVFAAMVGGSVLGAIAYFGLLSPETRLTAGIPRNRKASV